MGCAQAVMGKLVMKQQAGAPTWSGSDPMFEVYSEDIAKRRKIGVPNTIRGTRSRYGSRARFAPYRYRGIMHMPVNPGDLAVMLPWMLGANASGTTFALAETLQPFSMIFDRVTQTFEYQDCYVNRAVLHGKAGEGNQPDFFTLSMEVFAKTRTTGVSFPASALAHTGQYAPFVFQDCVLTLESATREVKELWLSINNFLIQRYVNSLSPTATCPADRLVQLRTRHPYDSGNSALLDTALAGAAGTLAITNGSVSTSVAFTNLKSDQDDPTMQGLGEIDLELDMTSYHDGATKEIVITNDSTP